MTTTDGFTEPGRHVAADGRIIYHWPPEGRFADIWRRLAEAIPSEDERAEAICLLTKWRDETSTLIGYSEDGVFYDFEPDWEVPAAWLV